MVMRIVDLIPGVRHTLDARRADELKTGEFWSEFVCKQKPVVVRAAVKDWPAVEKWKGAGYLEAVSPNSPVRFARTYNPVPLGPFFRYAMEDGNLDECIKEMRESSVDSTLSIPGVPVPQGWEDDLGPYGFLPEVGALPPRVYPPRRIFIYKNASTEWHYHSADETLTTQLLGRKRISLFKPDLEYWWQYAEIIEANFHHLESASCYFPNEKEAEKFEAEMEPGDVVYIPPMWWHGIDPLDSDLGVTLAQCFRTPLEACWTEAGVRP